VDDLLASVDLLGLLDDDVEVEDAEETGDDEDNEPVVGFVRPPESVSFLGILE
jgi:hypothetical protein